MELDRIDSERLLKIWPLSAVPKTRQWFADNVGAAMLTDVRAGLRLIRQAFADTERKRVAA